MTRAMRFVAGSLNCRDRDVAAMRVRPLTRERAAEGRPRSVRLPVMGSMTRLLVLSLSLLTAAASATERLDHHGAVGLLIGSGLDYRSQALPDNSTYVGFYLPVDFGGTYNVGDDSNELVLAIRGELFGPSFVGAIYGGYRSYFGQDAWKTFFDLHLRADVVPQFTVGPRMGFGAQFDPHALFGIYAGVGAHVGAGTGIRFGGELILGVQLRSFLLE